MTQTEPKNLAFRWPWTGVPERLQQSTRIDNAEVRDTKHYRITSHSIQSVNDWLSLCTVGERGGRLDFRSFDVNGLGDVVQAFFQVLLER